MTPVNLGKTLEYLKVQKSLPTESLPEYYLCKGIFLYVFFYPERYYTRTK